MFTHKDIQVAEPVETYIDGKRHYITPQGKVYPSMTTMLSAFKSHKIQEWRDRVGEKEADRVLKYSQDRGNDLHEFLEKYIQNESVSQLVKNYGFHIGSLFQGVKTILDRNLGVIYMQEKRLYSDVLRLAGRVDLIAEYQSILSIVDFKGAGRSRKEEYITDYFLQACGYSLMFFERTGIPVQQVVIIMSSDDGQVTVFKHKTKDYLDSLINKTKEYHLQKNG